MTEPADATPQAVRPAGLRGQFGWAMFDWANQPYFTVITTFIFAPYFATVVVGDPVTGQSYWGYIQGVAGLLIAILGPIFGAIADAGGPRKPWIATFSGLCIVTAATLWWAVPGIEVGLGWVALAVIVSALGVEFATVFNNAMLPSLVREERIGFLSGFGWGLGYLGGLAALFLVLFGFSWPEETLFDLDRAAHEHDRIVGPMTAVWFAVFIIPLFLFTPDAPRTALGAPAAIRQGLSTLVATIRRFRAYGNIIRFLVARMIYNDGILAVIGFSGIYAAGLFGWDTTALGIFGVIATVFAALGAFVGGWLDDRLGSKRTIAIALSGLVIGVLGIMSIGDGRALIFFEVGMPDAEGALFASEAERVLLVFAVLLGLCFGPAQAASRTMMARLAPVGMTTEFFGLFALSGKATAFLAPILIGIATDIGGTQRAGIAVVPVLLIAGMILLAPVREERAPPAVERAA